MDNTYKLSISDYMIATAIILIVVSAILMVTEKNGYIDQLFVYVYGLLVVGTFMKYFEFTVKE